ncbi:hypothetical protein KR032_007612 [Drosophila birchii]|nr:hypothetical protein KR032_007612 [Drosophila birchii]
MKLAVTSLIVVLVVLAQGKVLNKTHTHYRIPFGMAEFGPFRGKDIALTMPLSQNLSQIERLNWSEKCLPFRSRCKMAEHCCSQKCLVHIQRCNT